MKHSAPEEERQAARAKLFMNGRSQAVRLPREFRFEGDEVAIRREGAGVLLEPIAKRGWPPGYWRRVARSTRALELGDIAPLDASLLDLEPDDV